MNISSIPPVLRWLHYLDPLYYCLEAFTVNEISAGLAIRDTIAGVQVQVRLHELQARADPSRYRLS